jgi:hypothetical protein
MVGVQRARLPAPESRPYLAFGAALGLDMLLLLSLFVPIVWPIVVLAIGPYVGGRIGGRYAARREATYAGAVAAALTVTLLAVVFLYALGQFPGGKFTLLEPIGLTILVVGYLVAILFGALGGRHGAASRKKVQRSS